VLTITHIRVNEDTKKLLDELKRRGFATYDDLLKDMIRVYTDPKLAALSLVTWVIDMREDIKSIRDSLSELCNLLRNVEKNINLLKLINK